MAYNFILSESLSATWGISPLQYGQDASSDSDDHIDSSHTAKQNSFHMAELLDLWLFLLSRWPTRRIQCTAIWQSFISILFQSSYLFFIKLQYLLVYAANVVFDTLCCFEIPSERNAHAPYKSIYDNSPAIIAWSTASTTFLWWSYNTFISLCSFCPNNISASASYQVRRAKYIICMYHVLHSQCSLPRTSAWKADQR